MRKSQVWQEGARPVAPGLFLDVEGGFFGAHYTRNPQWPTQTSRSRSGAGEGFPSLIDGEGEIGVDKNVAVAIFSLRLFNADHLMPTVHTAHGVGVDGKRNVLVHAGVAPPDSVGVRVGALVG